MSEEMIPVGIDDAMTFACGPDNPCFNQCCRDLSQALTPYDVLRLKQAKAMDSSDFLREYTSMHFGPETGLPVVEFKPNPATGHACPFVSDAGCTVYPDRPASCRMYPLARAIARSRQTGEIQEYFALIEEDHCLGFGKESGQTVRQWLKGQEVEIHNHHNDKMMGLISLKNQIMPGKLEGLQADQFYLALYDLDTFRRRILEEDLLAEFQVPDAFLTRIVTDDTALLDFGMAWVGNMLFGHDIQFGE